MLWNLNKYSCLAIIIFIGMNAFAYDNSVYFENNDLFGGDVVIKKLFNEDSDSNTVVSFEVESKDDCEYCMSAWICPSCGVGGDFQKYQVSVNGMMTDKVIIPLKQEWHSASLSGNGKIKLQSGKNIVSILGELPFYPNVEHIRLSRYAENAKIDSRAYETFKSGIEQENAKACNTKENDKSDAYATMIGSLGEDDDDYTEDPLYDYTYAKDVSFRYTFHTTLTIRNKEPLTVTTKSYDNCGHILFVYGLNSTPVSVSSMSNSAGIASVTIPVEAVGKYSIMVRPVMNNKSGFCDVDVNGIASYKRVPITSCVYICNQDDRQEYNTFVVNKGGGLSGRARITIEEQDGLISKVYTSATGYLDDSDYKWNDNARIRCQYKRPVHYISLSAKDSFYPEGTCDLYAKCPNSELYLATTVVGNTPVLNFPELHKYEAIQSSRQSYEYNCVSWSGGITSFWCWPPDEESPFYNENPLVAFDNFYYLRGLTRRNATKDNAVVALWGKKDEKGAVIYTHASVKEGDGNMHGYDWESKPGSMMRTFHPRADLKGFSYGEILEYYTLDSNVVKSKSFIEKIADGEIAIEYEDFDDNELNTISNNISGIDQMLLNEWETLYTVCKSVFENTVYSNPSEITSCSEFDVILRYIEKNKDCVYMVFDRLSHGEFTAVLILRELKKQGFFKDVDISTRRGGSEMLNEDKVTIVRPLISNYVALARRFIGAYNDNNIVELNDRDKFISGKTYSNSFDFKLVSYNKEIRLDVAAADCKSIDSIILYDMSGREVYVSDKILDCRDQISFSVGNKGVYLAVVTVNGKINVKKIYVED